MKVTSSSQTKFKASSTTVKTLSTSFNRSNSPVYLSVLTRPISNSDKCRQNQRQRTNLLKKRLSITDNKSKEKPSRNNNNCLKGLLKSENQPHGVFDKFLNCGMSLCSTKEKQTDERFLSMERKYKSSQLTRHQFLSQADTDFIGGSKSKLDILTISDTYPRSIEYGFTFSQRNTFVETNTPINMLSEQSITAQIRRISFIGN